MTPPQGNLRGVEVDRLGLRHSEAGITLGCFKRDKAGHHAGQGTGSVTMNIVWPLDAWHADDLEMVLKVIGQTPDGLRA